MPLYTDSIEQARAAYAALEQRTQAAEQRVGTLQAVLDASFARELARDEELRRLRQQVANDAAQIAALQLQVQTLEQNQIRVDVTLDNFVAALGLALAVGEAAMPDRVVSSASAEVRAYLGLAPGTSIVGLRLAQPQDGAPQSLSTAGVQLARIPPGSGATTPPNLYRVLEDKQRVFTDSFWQRFKTSAAPPASPSSQIVAETGRLLSNTGAWTFAILVQEAAYILSLEETLAGLLAGAAPAPGVQSFASAAASLRETCVQLGAKAMPVASDLQTVASALASTTNLAKALLE